MALCFLLSLLALRVGSTEQSGPYLDLTCRELPEPGELGLLGAGHELWWREELVPRIERRQSVFRIVSGVWYLAVDWSAHEFSHRRALSSVQLARSVDPLLFATPFLQRQRRGSTWRLPGYLTPPTLIERNGADHPVSVRGLPSYVLEVPSDGEEDGSSLAVVLVVIKKPSGVLLAVPEGFFGDEALEEGMTAGPDDMMGPSRVVTVDAGRLENMDGSPPVAEQGAQLRVLLIDMTPGILGHLSKVADYAGPPEILHLLDPDPFRFPMRDDLVAAAWDWLVQPDAGDRIH